MLTSSEMALSWRMREKARVTTWPTGRGRSGRELPKYYFRPCSHLSLFRASMATSFPGFSLLLQPSWSHGSQNLRAKTEYGRGTKVNNCRYDKSYSMGARNEFATSFIINWWCGYLEISTTSKKTVLQKCKREKPGNEVCYSLGISCTSR